MAKARGKTFMRCGRARDRRVSPDCAGRCSGFGRLYTASTELAGSAVADFGSPDPGGEVSHHDVIAEWRVDATDANRVDPRSRREVLRIAHPLYDHTIGQIAFNPNAAPGGADYGMLYIGVGDGGDTLPVHHEIDSMRNAQNTRTLLGKMLRINPLPGDGRKYTVPRTIRSSERQAFSGNLGVRPAQPLILLGYRRKGRCSSSTSGGAGGGGQRGVAGANYGWSERREAVVNIRSGQPSDIPRMTRMGFTYLPSSTGTIWRAITGCSVYRGRLIPALRANTSSGTSRAGGFSTPTPRNSRTARLASSRRSSSSISAGRERCSRSWGTIAAPICASARMRPARSTCLPSETG
jgi:hypothetical protein